jgi:predicted CoA-binding protein
MRSLDAVFAPNAIAVIGASTTPGKVGYDIFANILKGGYTGTLYPVNSAAKSILSMRAYATIGEIQDAVDLSIIVLPTGATLKAVEESVKKGVKAIVIVSAGFREVGKKGLDVENEIVSICREAGVRIVGPASGYQPSSQSEHECELFRPDAQPGKHLLHFPERCTLLGRSRFRRRQRVRIFQVHLYRQQGRRGRDRLA